MSGSDLCIPRNETVWPCYFQNRIIKLCLPISTFMYLWANHIIPWLVCRENRWWEYINRSQIHECRNWERSSAVSFQKYMFRIFGTVWKKDVPWWGAGVWWKGGGGVWNLLGLHLLCIVAASFSNLEDRSVLRLGDRQGLHVGTTLARPQALHIFSQHIRLKVVRGCHPEQRALF